MSDEEWFPVRKKPVKVEVSEFGSDETHLIKIIRGNDGESDEE